LLRAGPFFMPSAEGRTTWSARRQMGSVPVTRPAIQSHGDPEKEVHVLTADDVARATRVALDRVESVRDSAETDSNCRVDHLGIAQAGVEEGLKLAMRVLRQQSGPIRTSYPDHTASAELRELTYPAPGVSH